MAYARSFQSRTPQQEKKLIYGVSIITLVVSMTLFFTWQRLQVTQLDKRLKQADRALTALRAYNKDLRLERINLMAPNRIKQYATSKLAMVSPLTTQVIRIP